MGANSHASLRGLPVQQVRTAIRQGEYTGHTAGLGLGYLQGNLAILPERYALDFFRYCQRNPKSCPLIGVSDTGDPQLPDLGKGIDIRCDVPLYNVYRDGELSKQVPDISALWQDDWVAFVLGCSFTFEEALMNAGISMRHIETNRTVAMYRSNIATQPAGPFAGPTVVSMRPIRPADIERAREITARYPQAHGEPIHCGDPELIGIQAIDAPDWGDTPLIRDGEVPVFWACGVTPQAALQMAKPSLCITHAPGRMLITDVLSMASGS